MNKNVILKNLDTQRIGYKIKLTNKTDHLYDFYILFDNLEIGTLQLTVHPEFLFIRHIGIHPEYRRNSHASNVIDYLCQTSDIPIQLCISTHSQSAMLFWKKYFIGKEVEHLKGETYSIKEKG